MSFETKDSGKREQFISGMVRDTQDGKTNFALVADGPLLKRWAELMTRGAVKYEKRNWMKAGGEAEYDRFRESAFRHFMQWYNGDIDEDHAAAVAFNINGAEYVNDKLDWQEESDCEAIERWNRDIFDTDGYRMNFNDRPPTTGPTVAQGDGDDGAGMYRGMPIEQIEAYGREYLPHCICGVCLTYRDYKESTISSTPVQVLNRADRPVDNA